MGAVLEQQARSQHWIPDGHTATDNKVNVVKKGPDFIKMFIIPVEVKCLYGAFPFSCSLEMYSTYT